MLSIKEIPSQEMPKPLVCYLLFSGIALVKVTSQQYNFLGRRSEAIA
jgi:hypothetical protein